MSAALSNWVRRKRELSPVEYGVILVKLTTWATSLEVLI
jgi:hypothetical protein